METKIMYMKEIMFEEMVGACSNLCLISNFYLHESLLSFRSVDLSI